MGVTAYRTGEVPEEAWARALPVVWRGSAPTTPHEDRPELSRAAVGRRGADAVDSVTGCARRLRTGRWLPAIEGPGHDIGLDLAERDIAANTMILRRRSGLT